MASITRTSSGASTHPHRASIPADADTAKAGKASHGTQHTALSDRPPSTSSADVERPRRTLTAIGLSNLRKSADTPPAIATSAATALCRQVDNGTIKLVGSYSATALTAAASVASQGLMALQREAVQRTDPLESASR